MGLNIWTEKQDQMLINSLNSNMTYRQIADQLGMSKAMVSGRIYRLRQKASHGVSAKYALDNKQIQRHSKAVLTPNHRLRQSALTYGKLKHIKLENIERQRSDLGIEKPQTHPIAFKDLPEGCCSFCVDDVNTPASADMMCCGADVVDANAREGDRRKTHCAYHLAMSAETTHAKPKRIYALRRNQNYSD